MINPRAQSVPKDIKQNIRPYLSLLKSHLRLYDYETVIDKKRVLNLLTGIQISHLLITIIDIAKKVEGIKLNDLSIGLIGCGVMGRVIVNGIIPLAKEGLNLQNVRISTRQVQNCSIFQKFGIEIQYNNEKLAQNSDIIFIATPATLDNWILASILQVLKQRKNKKSKTKPLNPLIFILTSSINKNIVNNLFGSQSLTILPYENFQGVNLLYQTCQQLWQTPHENLNQFIVQQRAFKLTQQHLQQLCQTITNFFALKSQKTSIHSLVLQNFEKPSLIDNFIEKYKRFKSLFQSL